jgi:hypothetical protein
MDEEEFKELWSATTTVILERVLTTYTSDDLQQVVKRLEQFD